MTVVETALSPIDDDVRRLHRTGFGSDRRSIAGLRRLVDRLDAEGGGQTS